eukprot:2705746-Alexandrium_andersonii.AAC.1
MAARRPSSLARPMAANPFVLHPQKLKEPTRKETLATSGGSNRAQGRGLTVPWGRRSKQQGEARAALAP